jgi:hypothetical protein
MSSLLKRERSSQGVLKMSGRGVGVAVAAGWSAEHEMRIKLMRLTRSHVEVGKERESLFIN